MAIRKFATVQIEKASLIDASSQITTDASPNLQRFKTIVADVKRVAERSDDFLYFVCRAIHAMEAVTKDPITASFNPKIGHIAHDDGSGACVSCGHLLPKNERNEPISGLWCKASKVQPYVNQNGDAFPEAELMKVVGTDEHGQPRYAYQTFVGKGLFVNHASDDAEKIRGIILDAAWDPSTKGVDILVACDRKGYPELARQIEAGYSNNVSMGTQVQYSLCSECGNRAAIEDQYCGHVKTAKGRGVHEVNHGLSFIEISVVSTGADPNAKIKTILAHYLAQANKNKSVQANQKDSTNSPSNEVVSQGNKPAGGVANMTKGTEKKAYMQGTQDPKDVLPYEKEDYQTIRDTQDKQMVGKGMESGDTGMHPGYELGSDAKVKEMLQRASLEERIARREKLVKGYFQGTVEPEKDAKPFDMGDYQKIRDTEDKQMVGKGMESSDTGMHPGYDMGSDEKVKEMLQRAKLRAVFTKSASNRKAEDTWTVFAGPEPILMVNAGQLFGEILDQPNSDNPTITNYDWVASRDYGKALIAAIKTRGFNEVRAEVLGLGLTKQAQEAAADEAPADLPPLPTPEAAEAAGEAAGDLPPPEAKAADPNAGIEAAIGDIEAATSEIRALLEGGTPEEGEMGEVAPKESEMGEVAPEEMAATEGEAGELAEAFKAAAAELGQLKLAYDQAVETKNTGLITEVKGLIDAAVADAKELTTHSVTVAKKLSIFKKKAEKMPTEVREMFEAKSEKKDECPEGKHAPCEDKEARASTFVRFMKEAKLAKPEASLQELVVIAMEKSKLYNVNPYDAIKEAHPKGGNTSIFPSDKVGGKIETVTEQQKIDVAVATKQPTGEVKARAEARTKIAQAIYDKMSPEQIIDRIIAKDTPGDPVEKEVDDKTSEEILLDRTGHESEKKEPVMATVEARRQKRQALLEQTEKTAAVDKETSAYYKELYGKGDTESKGFAKDLTSEFASKKHTAEIEVTQMRMKRAYRVASAMAEKGLIANQDVAKEAEVNKMMLMDDVSFKSFASLIENAGSVKTASASPLVRTAGAVSVGATNNETNDSIHVKAPKDGFETLADELSKLPWGGLSRGR